MNTEQEKAEKYVRKQIPELMKLSFGCEVKLIEGGVPVIFGGVESREDGKNDVICFSKRDGGIIELRALYTANVEDIVIIGHPIQLQHWLRVLLGVQTEHFKHLDYGETTSNALTFTLAKGHPTTNKYVNFDLTTGQPATEADYKAFNEIVGNSV